MYPAYLDITTRISDSIQWFDQNGCPRYDPFSPESLGVYCDVALLIEIECQSCGALFAVSNEWTRMDLTFVTLADGREVPFMRAVIAGADSGERELHTKTLVEIVRSQHFGYGDAPSAGPHRGCAGATMTTDPTRIVEAWAKVNFDWIRYPELEGPVSDEAGDG